jgi:hypothetical protein
MFMFEGQAQTRKENSAQSGEMPRLPTGKGSSIPGDLWPL